jgi:hypothetical protein
MSLPIKRSPISTTTRYQLKSLPMSTKRSLWLSQEVRRMSVPQLKEALRGLQDQFKRFSASRYELVYEDLLMTELECRGIDASALGEELPLKKHAARADDYQPPNQTP